MIGQRNRTTDGLYARMDRELHHKGHGKPMVSRKVGNNTWLKRHNDADESISLLVHDTHVLWVRPNDHVTLDSGQWRSFLTQDRMNAWLPRIERKSWSIAYGWRTFMSDRVVGSVATRRGGSGNWMVIGETIRQGQPVQVHYPFVDGMTIHAQTGHLIVNPYSFEELDELIEHAFWADIGHEAKRLYNEVTPRYHPTDDGKYEWQEPTELTKERILSLLVRHKDLRRRLEHWTDRFDMEARNAISRLDTLAETINATLDSHTHQRSGDAGMPMQLRV